MRVGWLDSVHRSVRRNLRRWEPRAGLVALLASGCSLPENPTFSADVAPILYERCVQCHRPNGGAPFGLVTYEDVRSRAPLIATAVRERRMPPWLPRPTEHPFANERRLSDREVAILSRWAEQGAPLGDPNEVPAPPEWPDGWSLGEPDLVVEMPKAYPVPGSGEDIFRHFVIPIPLGETRYVQAIEFQPGEPQVVHHVVIAVDSTTASREEDARDAEPGFDGMLRHASAQPPTGFFAGWTPGLVARMNPEDLVWPVDPGTDLVLQMHLRPHAGRPVSVRSRVGLYFAERPPERSPVMLRLGSQTIDIPAGDSAYVLADTLALPVRVSLLGIYPHAHYLARAMEVRAIPPEAEATELLRIDQWNFDWQDAYTFEEPVELPAGTRIEMRFRYDNSAANPRNPNSPPQRVVYGPRSSDEMAEVWIQAIPEHPQELSILQRALARKWTLDRVEGLEHLIRVNPADAIAHAGLAEFYDEAGDRELAEEHYRHAITAQPDLLQAHFNLGVILEGRGDFAGAAERYQAVVTLAPDHASALTALGTVLARRGQNAEAARHLRRAVQLDPDVAEAHASLGAVLRAEGQTAEAVEHYQRVVELFPESQPARYNLALALAHAGQPDEALGHFERANPATLGPEANLAIAWVLATHPRADARRPTEALGMADLAARSLGGPHPLVLDVAAAAYAAAGDFERAVAMAEDAARLAGSGDQVELASQIRERIRLYRAGRPFSQPAR